MNWSEFLSFAGEIAKIAGLIIALIVLCAVSLIKSIFVAPIAGLFLACFGLNCRNKHARHA